MVVYMAAPMSGVRAHKDKCQFVVLSLLSLLWLKRREDRFGLEWTKWNSREGGLAFVLS